MARGAGRWTWERRGLFLPLLGAVLALATARASGPLASLLGAAGALALGLGWPVSPRGLRLVVAGALALALVASARSRPPVPPSPEESAAAARARLAQVEARGRELVAAVSDAAARVAALPETRRAASRDRAALGRLFLALDELRDALPERPALAVHVAGETVAWAGRTEDPRVLPARPRRGVLVVPGTVSTVLVAVVPVGQGPASPLVATAEIILAVRRNIRNEYLSDYDRLTRGGPGLEVRYPDPRRQGEPAAAFAPLPPGAVGEERTLLSPDGDVLARVRAVAPALPAAETPTRARWHLAVAALFAFAGVLAALAAPSLPLRLAFAATALRAAALLSPLAAAWPGAAILSPDTYASTLLDGSLSVPGLAEPLRLGPLLRSPLDLLLTAAWTAALAGVLLAAVLRRGADPGPWRALAAPALALPLLLGAFGWVADTVTSSTLELAVVPLLPRGAAHLVLHLALLLVLATGGLALGAVFRWAGPLPPGGGARLATLLAYLGVALLASRLWPRQVLGLPLLPALLLATLAWVLAWRGAALRHAFPRATAGSRAWVVLAAVFVTAALLQPSLSHHAEAALRTQVERDYAPLVLRQPLWREYVLAESRRRIDSMRVLQQTSPGAEPPGLEEMAYAIWSLTDLAAFGFSSAVEVQDAGGAVISRFALNLPPSLTPARLPAVEEWVVERDRIALYSDERSVLHARRRLSYDGRLRGAIHVLVGADYWNLPFLTGRDPYSVLFRTAARGAGRESPVDLFALSRSGERLFASTESTPALAPELVARLRAGNALWTNLEIDDERRRAYLFADADTLYGLSYRRQGPGRRAAGVIEGATGLGLVAAAGLLALVLFRTVLRRQTLTVGSALHAVRRRFALRLFVAFTLLAFLPVLVVQTVVRNDLAERLHRQSEDQALERAAVAKKVVEDFALFQESEAGHRPVTDAALVWVASLIRNDLDVFERGQLVASSKRELYASGLLLPRLPGAVFRRLVLGGEPAVVREETIGDFSYQVVSVPVRLDAGEPGILSIPLALRQREVQAAVEDLDRTIRLASVIFLAFAAVMARWVSRRISEPVRDLTAATRRIAHGDLEARVSARSHDELEDLVDSFNRMAADLDRQRRELERSNRLAAWADMARQVAHEVKNPLTPIQLSAEHLRRVYGDPALDYRATLEACTQTILKQVRTLRGIVTEFSAFARPPAPELVAVDLAAVVDDAVRPYLAAPPPGVRVLVSSEGPALPVRADRRLLERAAVNLLENALQAVGEQGTVRVRVEGSEGRAVLEVSDDGPGIEPPLRERIFEPFFSTKTGGSGLGLALVKKIAEDHGGGIELATTTSAEEGPPGTRMRLWIPTAVAPGVDPGPRPATGQARSDAGAATRSEPT